MTHERPSWAIRIRVGLGLAVLCLAAPTVPPALADDGVPMPAAAEVADAIVNGDVSATVEAAFEAAASPVSAGPATALGAALPAVAAAGSVEAQPAAAPVAPPVPSVPILAPASAPQEPATDVPAPDAPPVPEEPAVQESQPIAVASQAQPVNVNVSVRIDSPGENGPVTQVNATDVAAVGPSTGASPEQYQPTPTQYQPTQPPAQASAATVAATPTPPASSPDPGWAWTWACGDTETQVLPPDVASEILPTNWTWNCGEEATGVKDIGKQNAGQYHAGVAQYQPVNINISIRINSPGNNGPVTQSNVVIVVIAPATAVAPALPVSIPASVLPPGSPIAAAFDAPAQTALLTQNVLFGFVPAADAEAVDWIFRGLTGRSGGEAAFSSPGSFGVRAQPPFDPASDSPTSVEPAGTVVPITASAWTRRAVAVTHAEASVRSDRPAGARSPRKTPPRPLPPTRAPALASGFAGAAPGGTDGGGWPLLALLLVPFSLALVDSSRRMGRDATLPAAAELRTRRDRPG